ncbi:GlyGly-CTERM domain-containing protein [Izhakiella capsodis]|uniref:GlyGly-CTERM domain-containing protein n=1 Tax=Izhakiella capsodis TaxID=1367852 RepID=A0A1I4UZB8_9GAMM|nr:YniB family protein [Izhakiella capsodis]SFM94312.1 GlyGly-CTERM domain-containing protein [Izhakiella capsodis]
MTYHQAGRIAIAKRILGWVIFIPAFISTLISLLKFLDLHHDKDDGINAVMRDFIHVMIDVARYNTPFLNGFWNGSPTLSFNGGGSIGFWIIFILIFVGLAFQASGARMWRQYRYVREGIEDRLILEKARGEEGQSRQALENRVVMPHHTIFLQIFPLYILPVIIVIVSYFIFKLVGFIH